MLLWNLYLNLNTNEQNEGSCFRKMSEEENRRGREVKNSNCGIKKVNSQFTQKFLDRLLYLFRDLGIYVYLEKEILLTLEQKVLLGDEWVELEEL